MLGYTQPDMAQRLLAFALAVTVFGAPIATDLCQAACAMRSNGAASHSAAGEHHSCHGEGPSSGPSIAAIHACGHTDQLPGGDRPERATTSVAILPAPTVVPAVADVAVAVIVPVLFAPPPPTAITSQLRV